MKPISKTQFLFWQDIPKIQNSAQIGQSRWAGHFAQFLSNFRLHCMFSSIHDSEQVVGYQWQYMLRLFFCWTRNIARRTKKEAHNPTAIIFTQILITKYVSASLSLPASLIACSSLLYFLLRLWKEKRSVHLLCRYVPLATSLMQRWGCVWMMHLSTLGHDVDISKMSDVENRQQNPDSLCVPRGIRFSVQWCEQRDFCWIKWLQVRESLKRNVVSMARGLKDK